MAFGPFSTWKAGLLAQLFFGEARRLSIILYIYIHKYIILSTGKHFPDTQLQSKKKSVQ